MSRYINMDDAITYPVMPVEYRKYQTMNLDDAYEQGWYDLQNLIEKMPTADVRENKPGEWIWNERCTDYTCSVCGEHFDNNTNFCPNCGSMLSESLKVRELGNIVAQGIQDGIKGAKNGN